jgi:hypothetical protein
MASLICERMVIGAECALNIYRKEVKLSNSNQCDELCYQLFDVRGLNTCMEARLMVRDK